MEVYPNAEYAVCKLVSVNYNILFIRHYENVCQSNMVLAFPTEGERDSEAILPGL